MHCSRPAGSTRVLPADQAHPLPGCSLALRFLGDGLARASPPATPPRAAATRGPGAPPGGRTGKSPGEGHARPPSQPRSRPPAFSPRDFDRHDSPVDSVKHTTPSLPPWSGKPACRFWFQPCPRVELAVCNSQGRHFSSCTACYQMGVSGEIHASTTEMPEIYQDRGTFQQAFYLASQGTSAL
uniref:uncharacterized protein LOC132661195 isoform X2 n=1 Tax=Panthera onca TaxID=9690 RepID=UPI00295513A2|nr:uncharacterized protein LOC132661195 isoform X2 [Panthera onca]